MSYSTSKKPLTPEQREWWLTNKPLQAAAMLPPPGLDNLLKLVTFQCDVSPWMLLASAGDLFATAIIGNLEPGWKDDVKIVTGKSWVHHGRMLVEEAEEVEHSVFQKGVGFIFDFAEIVDAWAWFLMVAAGLAEGFFSATSLLYYWSSCNPTPQEHALYSHHNFGPLTSHGEWQPAGAWDHVYGVNAGADYIGSDFSFPANSGGRVTWVLGYGYLSGRSIPIDTRLIDLATGDVLHQSLFNIEQNNPKFASIGHTGIIPPQSRTRNMQLQVKPAILYPEIYLEPTPGINKIAIEWTTPY